MEITLVGDSHHLFLGDYIAVTQLPFKFRLFSGSLLLEPFAALNDAGEIEWIQAAVKEKLGEPLKNDRMYGISVGAPLSSFAGDSMWRTHAPWRVSAQFGLHPVSDGLLRKMVIEHAAATLDFFDALAAGKFNAFIVEPPPQKRRHPAMKAGIAPGVFSEVDARWREIMRKEYEARGFRWIGPPLEAFDKDGFLKYEFDFAVEADTHHANTAYADLIVSQMLKVAATGAG
jgi:hypothetical protein